jgi:hypothetical protein
MDLLLTRDATIPPAPDHLYGRLVVYAASGMSLLELQTIEQPWVPEPGGAPCGEPDHSCVPVGVYQLALHNTAEHPRTFALVNPELGIFHEPADIASSSTGRVACLIHSGNIARQSKGCILVGLTRSVLNGLPDVADSHTALTRLLGILPWVSGHSLTIELKDRSP